MIETGCTYLGRMQIIKGVVPAGVRTHSFVNLCIFWPGYFWLLGMLYELITSPQNFAETESR